LVNQSTGPPSNSLRKSTPSGIFSSKILSAKAIQELRLAHFADHYREVLDDASRKNTTTLDVLIQLIGGQVASRRDCALARPVRAAHLPPLKTLAEYDFTFPKRIPKAKILRLFDLQFVERFGCAVFLGSTGLGKTHLLTALGYAACEKGISVRFSRVVDMINTLTTAQQNGTLQKRLKEYERPQLLLLDELGYLPIDKRGADLMFQVVASRYEAGSIVISTNRAFKDWGRIFDVDNTLATAMIDRLMHHGEAIVIQGDRSYRNPEKSEHGLRCWLVQTLPTRSR
jgi:DNA replication protein DnaC